MNKKRNTLFFILGGTVFNIVLTIGSFLVLLVLYSRLLHPMLPESAAAWALPVIFFASIVASFLVYQFALKMIMKKVDMEKYFDPIFGRRPPKKN